jgi:hypothetical protein
VSYNEEFAQRIKKLLTPQATFIEKQMFGGVAFMVDEKMCVGINRDKVSGEDRLMARIGPAFHFEALKLTGCREMLFTGRAMPGFVFVHAEGYETDDQLKFWIDKALEFNRAIPEKPRKKRALLLEKEKKAVVKPLPKLVKAGSKPEKKAAAKSLPAADKKAPAKKVKKSKKTAR